MSKPWQLVILDRDGVINHDSDEYIKSPDEWQTIPGSLAAIAKLNQLQIPVVVCTNQSGIGRGLLSLHDLSEIHEKLAAELKTLGAHIDDIYFCPHTPDNNCNCRKPKPGLYLQALKDFAADPKHTLVIGDSLRDIEAAQTAGCHAVLVKTGKGERTLAQHPSLANDIEIYDDLAAVVKKI